MLIGLPTLFVQRSRKQRKACKAVVGIRAISIVCGQAPEIIK
jgi:hypothetical protein